MIELLFRHIQNALGYQLTVLISKCNISLKYCGRQLSKVWKPQSNVMFATASAYSGRLLASESHGTRRRLR